MNEYGTAVNYYYSTDASINGASTWATVINGSGIAFSNGSGVGMLVNSKDGIHPTLAFKYIKSKFGLLEGIKLKIRLARLEKAFNQAVDNGQEALGEKFLREVTREARESMIAAKGITKFIERDDINKVKNKIRDGHISDTKFEYFIKVVPKDVLEKKKKTEGIFDGYVIYHYYNPEVEKKIEKKLKMTPDEHAKMKDPILFGWIKETNRLYFIADWEDEYCDLTFEELVDVVGENKLEKYPNLN